MQSQENHGRGGPKTMKYPPKRANLYSFICPTNSEVVPAVF